jgi:cyanophycin synthetase
MSRDFPVDHTILFSLKAEQPALADHVAAGGTVVTVDRRQNREVISVADRSGCAAIIGVDEIPATMGGVIRPNVENAMAAVALAHGLSMAPETIARGLQSFSNSVDDSPGRFNFIEGLPVTLLIDFAHNPIALRRAIESAEHIATEGQRICVFTSVGNRSNRHFAECARVLAGHFDTYIFFEREIWRRGRRPNETNEHLRDGLVAAGSASGNIHLAGGSKEAAQIVGGILNEGDVVEVFGTEFRESLTDFTAACRLAGRERSPPRQ